MYDIITVGSATLDIFLRSNSFKINNRGQEYLTLSGGKVEIGEKKLAVGGGGTNTAVGFSRLGLNCACVARFGDDWAGRWLRENLESETFSKSYLSQVKGEETDLSVILLSGSGERIILTSRGRTRIDKTVFPADLLSQTRWLYLSSLEGNVRLLADVVDQADDLKVFLALNPGYLELKQKAALRKIFSKVTVLIVNEEEARFFWGANFLKEVAKIGILLVVITCGKNGAYYCYNGQIFKESIKKGKVVDATGAGDAFSVGLIAGLIWNCSPQEAVWWGMVESSSVVTQIGAKDGLLAKEVLLKELAKWKKI